MIQVGDKVVAKVYSSLENLLMALGMQNTGIVVGVGQAGDCEVLFDGTTSPMVVAILDLEIAVSSASVPGLLSNFAGFNPDPWFDTPSPPARKERKCDCGAAKAKTTHAFWCSLNDEDTKPN